MKKILTAAVALFCMTMMSVSLTSCSSNDNPVETGLPKVKMADVVTLKTVPQSLYKLDTQDIIPYFVIVDGLYHDADGNELMYDYAEITEAKIDEQSKYANSFTVDIKPLARHGYIKLIPNQDDDAFWDGIMDGIVLEDFGEINFDMQLKNKSGETLTQNIKVKYVNVPSISVARSISVADLAEDKSYIMPLESPSILELDLNNIPVQRFTTHENSEGYDVIGSSLTADGNLRIATIGIPSDPGEPSKVEHTYIRKLVGIPDIVPEEDLTIVNFRINATLFINE